MSDLISREETLERLQILKKFNTAEIIQNVIDAVEQQINFCKTAFDKEKVIEEIKVLSTGIILNTNICDDYAEGYVRAAKDIIEIVEKGGIE